MACAFCLTGKMGLIRHLTAGEIVGQVRVLADALGLRDKPFNIVLMGMGEPLHNYDETMKALRMLADEEGFALPLRRVTLSTVGLLPALERLAKEPIMPNLAISLHATTDEVRSRLMPVNRSFDLAALMASVRRYPLAARQRIFFEYVMLEDVNDTSDDAQRLARLLRGVKAKVNLIPFNDWEVARLRSPPLARILAFQSILLDAGITTTVRWSKGEDIGAACGQLRESPAVTSLSASS